MSSRYNIQFPLQITIMPHCSFIVYVIIYYGYFIIYISLSLQSSLSVVRIRRRDRSASILCCSISYADNTHIIVIKCYIIYCCRNQPSVITIVIGDRQRVKGGCEGKSLTPSWSDKSRNYSTSTYYDHYCVTRNRRRIRGILFIENV